MKLKLRYLILSAVIFTTVLSCAQPAKASSYQAVRAISHFISNPTFLTGLIAVIVLGLLIIRYAR